MSRTLRLTQTTAIVALVVTMTTAVEGLRSSRGEAKTIRIANTSKPTNGTNNSTSGNSTSNVTGCTSYATETLCVADSACVWDPVTLACYYDSGSNSGSATGNNTNGTSGNSTNPNCTTTNNGTYVGNGTNPNCGNGTSGNNTIVLGRARSQRLRLRLNFTSNTTSSNSTNGTANNSTSNVTGCTSYATETLCVADSACVWDPVTLACYYDSGSNSGSATGNNTNGTSGNSTNPNCTTTNNGTYVCSNGTSGNNTIALGRGRLHRFNLTHVLNSTRNATRRSRRAPSTRCRAARVAHHCGAIKACFWDTVGSLCREAVVSSVDAVAQPGSTVVRSTNTTPKSSVAALVACAACAALVVASVIGAAVLRARRGRKADEAERVPIVRADGVSSDMEA